MDFLRLFADLRLDRVLSLGQVRRRFAPGHDEDDVRSAIVWAVAARRLTTWPEWVALTARARTIRRVDFVALRPLFTTSNALRHHCGIAEMRWRLGARVRAWDAACAPSIGRDKHPDAIAETLCGLLAVEYDAGSYSSEQIQEKAHTFHVVFGQQIWGAPSAARVQWLRRAFRKVLRSCSHRGGKETCIFASLRPSERDCPKPTRRWACFPLCY